MGELQEAGKMTELEKMQAGLEYCFKGMDDFKYHAGEYCLKLNTMGIDDPDARDAVIRKLFSSVGEAPTVMPGFNCDRGTNITLGDNVLINYNVSILDIGPVEIGNEVLIGPGTVITTVDHAVSPEGRLSHLACMHPVRIEDNVWIGANCSIMAGVTIGEGSVVAAGAVVTKDVPARTVVAGVPARKIKDI